MRHLETFLPPSQGGAPEWAQWKPGEARYPAALVDQEQNALRRLSPRRNRWPEVAEFDARVSAIEGKRARLAERTAELTQATQTAEAEDREALAIWMLDPSKPRPLPAMPALETELTEIRREMDALLLAEAATLEQKTAFVERHRARLIKDADRGTVRAREAYERAIAALRGAREELIEVRGATVWAAAYLSAAASQTVPTAVVCAGVRGPVERSLGISAQVPAEGVFGALLEDARVLREVATHAQQEALGMPARDTNQATWAGSPEALEREKIEKREKIEAFTREWGRPPPEWT